MATCNCTGACRIYGSCHGGPSIDWRRSVVSGFIDKLPMYDPAWPDPLREAWLGCATDLLSASAALSSFADPTLVDDGAGI